MSDWEENRKKRLAFLGQRDTVAQTDDFIHSNSQDFCSACNRFLLNKPNNSLQLSCGHSFCLQCLKRLATTQINIKNNLEIRCPICSKPLNDNEIDIIDPKFTKIITDRFAKQFGQTVICPKCKADFILEPGAAAQITIDINGEKIRPAALECLRQFRVTCPICHTNFCAKCNSIPFHEGFTCEEQKLLDDDVVCRFCQVYPAIGCEKLDACHRVCWRQECRECLPQACMHVCDCGHACCGIKNEKNHFGCALCTQKLAICVICNESCALRPSVLMECGHPVHKNCLELFYQSLSEKGRIHIPRCWEFSCDCIPYHECVKSAAQRWKDISNKVEEITQIRMKLDDIENEQDHVKNPNDKDYFKQPLKFARDFFVFYICDKCKNPFFAGRKDCGDDDPNDNGPHECLRCNRKLMNSICPKHGETGMVIKCMFCCNPSLFFCFGTTYFCEICHQRPSDVQKGPWPQCDGKCKFAPHPPNGQQTISAYCVLCEQEKENAIINHK
ncbi:regulation of axon guidance [Tritrichomonas musculus]|uniref:Regulation of axon guidance n=1 Tax=Tritrichomonas musculus TaxID=1915356 RepID=A0ABR2JWT3_9EUKA